MDKDWNSGSVTGRDRHDNYIPWSKKHNNAKDKNTMYRIVLFVLYSIVVWNVRGDWSW